MTWHLLNRVFLYSRKWRFLFNVEKSKAIVFTLKTVRRDTRSLYLGVEKLAEVSSFRSLGVDRIGLFGSFFRGDQNGFHNQSIVKCHRIFNGAIAANLSSIDPKRR